MKHCCTRSFDRRTPTWCKQHHISQRDLHRQNALSNELSRQRATTRNAAARRRADSAVCVTHASNADDESMLHSVQHSTHAVFASSAPAAHSRHLHSAGTSSVDSFVSDRSATWTVHTAVNSHHDWKAMAACHVAGGNDSSSSVAYVS